MASNFKIQNMSSLNVQVTQFPPKSIFSLFNFIPSSRILPQFRVYIPINRLNCLSLSQPPSPISISENSSNKHSFEVSYLIKTFGWPSKIAISKAKYLKFKNSDKPEKMLTFFKNHGFTKTQISHIFQRQPWVLLGKPEKTFSPKFEFLSSLGLSRAEIADVVTKSPYILKISLEKIVQTFNLLYNLVNSYDEAVKMVKCYPAILSHNPEVDDIQILREAGVPTANIVVFMSFLHKRYATTPDSFRNIVEEVKKMGFDPSTRKFLFVLQTFKLLDKPISEDKLQVYKKYGWSDREFFLALEKYPKFLMFSKDKIERVLDFLVNTMGIKATYIAKFPNIFGRSLEKRIVPRCLVYKFVLEKGLCKRKYSIYTYCSYREAEFLDRFIKPYENEAPELWDLYRKPFARRV